MHTGTVKFFNEAKGYGFIKHDDSEQETFVHVTGLLEEVRQNDRVQFSVQRGTKGQNAVDVKVI